MFWMKVCPVWSSRVRKSEMIVFMIHRPTGAAQAARR
jgi:hypothetical protein